MSVIDNYFNHFKDRVNESHRLDIINMYNNIQTYDYCDLFDTDLSFNTAYCFNNPHIMQIFTLLQPKLNSILKATVISTCKTKIYKMYIFQNDKCKNYFIINALREFYYQTKFREALINNNIQNIIVPEIYRYGIINIETNNEIICFAEMNYYDQHENNLYRVIAREKNNEKRIEKIYNYIEELKSVINTIRIIEKQIQIYHNDITSVERLNKRFIAREYVKQYCEYLLEDYTIKVLAKIEKQIQIFQIDPLLDYNFNMIYYTTNGFMSETKSLLSYLADVISDLNCSNLFYLPLISKFILIDFEISSIMTNSNSKINYMQHILNHLIIS